MQIEMKKKRQRRAGRRIEVLCPFSQLFNSNDEDGRAKETSCVALSNAWAHSSHLRTHPKRRCALKLVQIHLNNHTQRIIERENEI